jgi:DNA-binding Xre family transcriptional regulator
VILCHLEERISEREGLTMFALAKIIAVNRNTLARMMKLKGGEGREEGRVMQLDTAVLDKLCRFFNCPLSDIISWSPEGQEIQPVRKPGSGRYRHEPGSANDTSSDMP